MGRNCGRRLAQARLSAWGPRGLGDVASTMAETAKERTNCLEEVARCQGVKLVAIGLDTIWQRSLAVTGKYIP